MKKKSYLGSLISIEILFSGPNTIKKTMTRSNVSLVVAENFRC
jgi:hypothetical protein